MPSPFPGMDPWLEASDAWGGLHGRLVSDAVSQLLPQLRPRGYYADGGERIWVEESQRGVNPDVVVIERPGRRKAGRGRTAMLEADEPIRVHALGTEFREPFVEIYDAQNRRLVTSIEFLSPTNKSTTKGRKLFQKKRREIRRAGVNLVEIDLLRGGRHLLAVPEALARSVKPWDYLVCVLRPKRSDYELYPMRLREKLKRIHIPLKRGEPDVVLDLGKLFAKAYDGGPYPDRIDYNAPPSSPLPAADDAWADEILRKAKLRTSESPQRGR